MADNRRLARRLSAALVVIGLAAPLVSAEGPSAAATTSAPKWSRTTVTEPHGTFDGELNGAWCPAATNCVAVGWGSTTGSLLGTLVEHWNGTSWAPEASPNPSAAGEVFPQMNAVTCLSASSCTAVGTDFTYSNTSNTIVETWNGTAWSVIPSPNVSGATDNTLEGVSCESATLCMAVGSAVTTSPNSETLIEQWNGTSWSIDDSPNVTGALQNTLTSVACPSSVDCVAVGGSLSSGGQDAITELWNGTSWSMSSPAVPSESVDDELTSVFCTAASNCVVVGRNWATESSPSTTLAEQWNGVDWSVVPTPNPTGILGDFLVSVSCATSTTCEAVGESYLDNDGDTETLVEQLSNGAWSLEPSPNAKGVTTSSLSAVACPRGSTACIAVGQSYAAEEDHLFALKRSSSTWSSEAIAGPALPASSYLQGAACSTTTCVAVGYTYPENAADSTGLVHRWNGKKWSEGSSSAPAGAEVSALYGASCPSPAECIAVGDMATDAQVEEGQADAYAEEMTGSAWSAMTVPTPSGAEFAKLTGVSCSATTACTAVGYSETEPGAPASAFAERFSGGTWKLERVASPAGTTATTLNAVSCPTAKSCTAVGSEINSSNMTVSLIEHWDGSSWSVSTGDIVPGAVADQLLGISCAKSSACVAAGYSEASGGTESALAETLANHSWKLALTPDIKSAFYNVLTGVTCTGTSDCLASGYSANDIGDTTRLAQWNGRTWAYISTGRIEGDFAAGLNGVACTSASFCMAAGSGPDGAGQDDALIEQN